MLLKFPGALFYALAVWRSSAVGTSFPCSAVQPVKDEPADATEVHPAHVSVVMAMGDSITAGFAARSLFGEIRVGEPHAAPLEFRDLSFSGGVGSDSHWTLPYLLSHYNSSLAGFSTGRTLPQLPSTGYLYEKTNALNAALSNAHSYQLHMQIDELKNQSSSMPDFDSRWKVLTLLIGANDLCDGAGYSGFDGCEGVVAHTNKLVERYTANLRHTLTVLRDSFRHIIVQVVSIFSLGSVKRVRAGNMWCGIRQSAVVECNCLDKSASGGSAIDDAQLDRLDATVSTFNDRIETVAQEFNLQRPDFAVVAATTARDQPIPDMSYLSKLDCFHPSDKAHEILAQALWNSMFDQSRVSTPLNATVPLFCPTPDSKFYVGEPAHAATQVV